MKRGIALILTSTLCVVLGASCVALGAMLFVRTFDDAGVIQREREANERYLHIITALCPQPQYWLDAFKSQRIPVEYQVYDPATHATPTTLVGDAYVRDERVRHVLMRMDGKELKFGSELMYFDEHNCPVLR